MRGELSPLTCWRANVFTCTRDLYYLSKHFQETVVLSSFQLQNSKMLSVDLFEVSIFNDQFTNVTLKFQSSQGKQGRPRLDDSVISSLIRVFVFIMQTAHV